MAFEFFTKNEMLLSLHLNHVTLFPPNRLFSKLEHFFPNLQELRVNGLSALFSEIKHANLKVLYISTQ